MLGAMKQDLTLAIIALGATYYLGILQRFPKLIDKTSQVLKFN